jgi:predicted aspartyl protease
MKFLRDRLSRRINDTPEADWIPASGMRKPGGVVTGAAKMKAILAGLLLVCAAAAPAFAECGPLAMVTSVTMRLGNDGRVYVPVKIQGADRSMLVDTGGFFSEITSAAVAELDLNTRHTGLRLIGVAGDTTNVAASASFALGNLRASSMDLMVVPDNIHHFASDVTDMAGILAPNLLRSYDADFDFGAGKFNLMSQDHCDGKVIYWPADTVAVVPMQLDDNGHINFPVQVDGQSLTAMMDTGASQTTMNLDIAAERFGLHPGDAAMPATSHLQGHADMDTYSHRFASLAFEGIAIGNPNIEIIPDIVHNKLRDPRDTLSNDTRIKAPSRKTALDDLIIGMDILHRLHVYIAYRERKLYITPAAAPAKP